MSTKIVLQYQDVGGGWYNVKGSEYDVPNFDGMENLGVAHEALFKWIEDKGWANVHYRLHVITPVFVKRVTGVTNNDKVVEEFNP